MHKRVVTYKYSINDILKEVDARTSVIAKHRATKDAPDRLEELALTAGEFFVFLPLLKKAVADVYEWTAPFSRNLPDGCKCDDTIYGDVVFFQEALPWFDDNKVQSVSTYIKEAIVNHIISRWFVTVLPDDAPTYWAFYEEAVEQVKTGMDSENHILKRSATWLQ